MSSVHAFQRGQAWYAGITFDGLKKQQIALKLYGGEADKARAQAAAMALFERLEATHLLERKKADARLLLGEEVVAPKPLSTKTVREWWDEYDKRFGPYRPGGGLKSPKSLALQARTKAHWLPLIGHFHIAALQPTDCAEAQQTRRHAMCLNRPTKQVEESTIKLEVTHVQTVLNMAVTQRVISSNPFVGAPKLQSKSRDSRILKVEDEVKLFALSEVQFHPRWRRFIRFLLLTGLRIDELLNTEFRQISGAKASVVGKGRRRREVGLVEEARQILAEQMLDQGNGASPRPAGCTRPWWHTPATCGHMCKVIAERAGIPHFSPHDLRHTFGHRWLLQGRDIKLLSMILGHKSVAVTERHYAFMGIGDVSDRMLAVMESAS